MPVFRARLRRAFTVSLLASTAIFALPARAEEYADSEIVVTAQPRNASIENAPSTSVTLDAARIATTVNAVNIEDAVKYLPSLVVRKRHIGDNFAPLATRTSGLGSSARSLIYADGVLLSALIGNNNGNASPRWNIVAPEEVARIDVLYGPFAAAYSGNSIGAVVNITTRMPEKLEARGTVLVNVQDFSLYGTQDTYLSTQYSGSVGDRFGPLSLFFSATRTDSKGQPVAIVTATRPAAPSSSGTAASGGFDGRNRTGAAIRNIGAGDIDHHSQDIYKLKAKLDVSDSVRLTYVGALWTDDSSATAETYLTNSATGLPVYTGSVNLGGYSYTIGASSFSNGVYAKDARHWSHALSFDGASGPLAWQVIGTSYEFATDIQRSPTGALPAAFTGGAGNVVRLDGTGWRTVDAKASLKLGQGDAHLLSFGGHWDRYRINSNRYSTTDWTAALQGALNQASRGRTRTSALWVQDAVTIVPNVTLTLGGRYEWWRASDGFNFSTTPALNLAQPPRTAHGFSPKASVEWIAAPDWSVRLSTGQAYRFPTVGELYQAITTGSTLSSPNPDLRPERARSIELAVERRTADGSVRVSLFNEVIRDALISQTGLLGGTSVNFVQNIPQTRARGAELAVERRDILPGIDVTGSLTYADAVITKNPGVPASVGKLLPSVPHWKGSAVLSWRATDAVTLTTAARFTSRNYGQIDNADFVGQTYQGFYKYFVVDARATYRVNQHVDVAVGIDNLNNDKYFLFHPFPQRSVTAQVNVKL